jgi:hypothetical protein
MVSTLFRLTDGQPEALRPFFPESHGMPRGDDRRVPSRMIFIRRNGSGRYDALRGERRHDRRDRPQGASRGLDPAGGKGGAGGQRGRRIGQTQGGLNTKPHAAPDPKRRARRFFIPAGQVSDDTGAAALPGRQCDRAPREQTLPLHVTWM